MNAFLRVADLPLSLRNQYLASLQEPQEWFLEELVRSGEVWESPGEGYAIFHADRLVEFYAKDRAKAHLLLSNLIQQRPFRKVLCKSFDRELIDAAKTLGWAMVETGFLFRKRTPVILSKIDTFQFARARAVDLSDAWITGRDFYDSKDEVEQIYRSNGLWIAFNDGQLVGSGVMIPIDGSGDVVDIGMVTRRSQRKKWFASLIVSELANVLESEGKRPICGCAESNFASKAALENAGFVSQHRLVQISVPD
ncbi:GNAT family N-acetyltransferase [Pseudosulfitobacter sp. SM2401]|uniref:GNAT family N-acetyltransferase n=1 Tax=Pseudosulfitobacter sp. SM2401 TaxID=3350098 RepID=UPI0036F1CB1C